MHKRFDILDVHVSAVNLDAACQMIDDFIKLKKSHYVCVAPVSTIVSCQDDQEYKKVINGADIVTPDGMPLVWLARMKGLHEVNRTYGPDLMLKVCEMGQGRHYRHYFLGGTEKTCQRLEESLKEKFPQIDIVGTYAPPFRQLTEDENQAMIDRINEAQPDLVWVGLGSPKQDFWMKQNRGKLRASVILGVGAAFDFLSGIKPQAPVWMRQSGLEWLFRLCCEPKRLWKRYLLGNAKFVYLLMKNSIAKRISKV